MNRKNIYAEHIKSKYAKLKRYLKITSALAVLFAVVGLFFIIDSGKPKVETIILKMDVERLSGENEILKRNLDDLLPPCMKKSIFTATAYEPSKKSCGKWAKHKKTKTGTTPAKFRTIAVDKNVIPLGSIVFIANIGWFIAEDTGSAVKGNVLDIFMESKEEANVFGRKQVTVYHPNNQCFNELNKSLKHQKSLKILAFNNSSFTENRDE